MLGLSASARDLPCYVHISIDGCISVTRAASQQVRVQPKDQKPTELDEASIDLGHPLFSSDCCDKREMGRTGSVSPADFSLNGSKSWTIWRERKDEELSKWSHHVKGMAILFGSVWSLMGISCIVLRKGQGEWPMERRKRAPVGFEQCHEDLWLIKGRPRGTVLARRTFASFRLAAIVMS